MDMWQAESCGKLVFKAAKDAVRQCKEIRCDFLLMDCEVFVRPVWVKGPRPAYFWLGAEAEAEAK